MKFGGVEGTELVRLSTIAATATAAATTTATSAAAKPRFLLPGCIAYLTVKVQEPVRARVEQLLYPTANVDKLQIYTPCYINRCNCRRKYPPKKRLDLFTLVSLTVVWETAVYFAGQVTIEFES